VCGPDEWLAHPGSVGRARPGRRLSIVPAGPMMRPGRTTGRGRRWGATGRGRHHLVRHAALRPLQLLGRRGGDCRNAWRGAACTVGDLGRLDDEGYLYLTGRRHDLIISGGVNVYPAEVEAVLSAVPGVLQLAVFGVPDEQWGQKVCVAYVTDRAGAEGAMRAAATAHLAPYKRPKDYFATAELPHTATGKLLRRAVPAHLGLAEGPPR
jgi:acyl-CoA synthetase (AMP-forming)/AMP-acid ligase II